MCGFIVTQNKHMAVTMLQRQEFRGPDGMDFWSDDSLTIGHALLDISGQNQKQPYKTKKGHIIVFNGEMYDTTQPNDTKFLANGYAMYGLSFLEVTNWYGSIGIYKGACRRMKVMQVMQVMQAMHLVQVSGLSRRSTR